MHAIATLAILLKPRVCKDCYRPRVIQPFKGGIERFRTHIPPDGGEMLSGIVAVDEAWFGKRRFGGQKIVIGAIETDTRKLRLQIIPDTEQDSIELFLEH